MDGNNGSTNANPPIRSRLPRPLSMLPVPSAKSGVRASPSRESLKQTNIISVPRVRTTPSRDQLSSTRGIEATAAVPSTPSKLQSKPDPRRVSSIRKPSGQTPAGQQEPLNRQGERITPRKPHQTPPHKDIIEDGGTSKKPRPSLSERTMETLSQLPPSPAVTRRRSSFFNSESPMRPPSRTTNGSRPNSRPVSSHQSDAAIMPPPKSFSRPGSSAGYKGEAIPLDFRASTSTLNLRSSSFTTEAPRTNPVATKTLKTPLKAKSNVNLRSSAIVSKLPSSGSASASLTKSPIIAKSTANTAPMKSGSKTLTSRPLKPRAPVGGLFRKPSMPELDQRGSVARTGNKVSPTFSNTSSDSTSITSKDSVKTTSSIESVGEKAVTPRKTSLTLREQIAKAKAAKRAEAERQSLGTNVTEPGEELSIIPAGTFDFGLAQDPFNQQAIVDGNKGLLRKRLDAARTDGRLNIAAMGLKEIPPEVMNMYNFDAINGQGGSWAESVDLTRFIAADNELEMISDDIFPDIDPREMQNDDDSNGNQFGGLETLDLHGNLLKALPQGLRRLELLTTLNLANNQLDNHSFDVISQISTLRDLKFGSNNLFGELNSNLTNLRNLEVLDVRNNQLTSLPAGLAELVRLRILNISQNGFTSLPFQILHRLPITELSASKNKLDGVLIATSDIEMPQLQILDVSVNALSSLAIGQIELPSLHQLNCSSNRLASLPDMTTWKSLLTLAAEDNNISAIPNGFVTLIKIKNVDFSGNSLRVLDDEIGRMESLDIFRINGNPLREKKFSGMTVESLRRALSARLAPPEPEIVAEELSEVFTSCPSSPTRPSSSHWPVKTGGTLDRSNTQSYSLDPVISAQVAATNAIRVLELHHNFFKEIPSSIEFFAASLTTLSLAHNDLSNDAFLKKTLELPNLKELNLSSNTITSTHPLTQYLHAPQLEKLDISFNRLTSLPVLRTSFRRLTVVLASHNSIEDLHPDAVKGLKILDSSSNDIGSLNARIGLLGGPGGLEKLDVSGNRFRVPKYTVLEKGTEATLAWLRDRIPAEETSVEDID